ncbi:FAD/NAD(P)-binding domain-containing protein [Massarina eburnea CBS 473.64]|uniref:FAD/NAD(P)-binding domain-containing protein n=1 Tax=Massarina eburnea CBS 473.64 TaxID=1395130 RepID=A0A6A6SGL1_9PLEO|nr:FAD/NAD(P)-binding domain-containing protein [Massarina eburnea CBS 473.64]
MAGTRESEYDLIVIGAGIAGLVAAQRWLDSHPTSKTTLLEKTQRVGGVFGRRRLYPDFYTQWTVGLAEFADLRMPRPPEENCIKDFFRAKYTMKYLEEYAAKMSHNGKTFKERIISDSDVTSVEKVYDTWHDTCIYSENEKTIYTAERMVVAAGEHDSPYIPELEGQEDFAAPIIPFANFGASNILSAPNTRQVIIVGAGKSSADMFYKSVRAGRQVTWTVNHLRNGEEVPCDALLLGIGWRSYTTSFSEDTATRLGLPHDPALDSPEARSKWKTIEAEGDAATIKRFPLLAAPPPYARKTISLTPWRLYNGIVPVDDHSIVFINHFISENMMYFAEVQAMWIVAYFDGNITLPSRNAMENDIAHWKAYSKRRYLSSHGQSANFRTFDLVPHTDNLLSGLGSQNLGEAVGKQCVECE